MATRERDEISNVETTGHEWDGIKELNNPLPRWWVWTFYATIVWAIGYMIAYPSIPLFSGATQGLLGYSSRQAVANDIAAARAAQGDLLNKISATPLEDILKDPALLEFARAGGAAAFKVNCVQCHGSGAAGGSGYPNLNDDDWLWGGTADAIHTTLQNGIRYTANADTRDSLMPAFGADGILTAEQIGNVADYVMSLSKQEHDAASAAAGQQVYADNCASCHGDAGQGGRDFGAPRLDDAIALYAGTKEQVVAQVTKPRHGVMPAWGGRLDEATIKQLAVYVHSLGGGEAAAP